jgi:hypothetical protein
VIVAYEGTFLAFAWGGRRNGKLRGVEVSVKIRTRHIPNTTQKCQRLSQAAWCQCDFDIRHEARHPWLQYGCVVLQPYIRANREPGN